VPENTPGFVPQTEQMALTKTREESDLASIRQREDAARQADEAKKNALKATYVARVGRGEMTAKDAVSQYENIFQEVAPPELAGMAVGPKPAVGIENVRNQIDTRKALTQLKYDMAEAQKARWRDMSALGAQANAIRAQGNAIRAQSVGIAGGQLSLGGQRLAAQLEGNRQTHIMSIQKSIEANNAAKNKLIREAATYRVSFEGDELTEALKVNKRQQTDIDAQLKKLWKWQQDAVNGAVNVTPVNPITSPPPGTKAKATVTGLLNVAKDRKWTPAQTKTALEAQFGHDFPQARKKAGL